MNVTVENLTTRAATFETMAEFGKPIDESMSRFLQNEGFSGARVRAVGCLGWIWCQWLMKTSLESIRERVAAFVERGMQIQDKPSKFYMRSRHDLYLLHCAIFASPADQLRKLAERVVDTTGHGGHTPGQEVGELYASAWCGMLKYWILGDREKAIQQSSVIWDAYRDSSFRAAGKPLVVPWLKGDHEGFRKAQQKDFEALWKRGRKDGIVKSETNDHVVLDIKGYSIEQLWCWAHCGLALLSHRESVQVATDPFWFPSHALDVVAGR